MRGWVLCCVLFAGGSCVASESIGKDLAEGGEGGTETGGDTTGTSSTDDTGTGAEPGPCDPEVGDDACVACQKQNCCGPWEACRADDRCICITVCHYEGHTLDACYSNCGMDNGEHLDLLTCSDGHCPDECQ